MKLCCHWTYLSVFLSDFWTQQTITGKFVRNEEEGQFSKRYHFKRQLTKRNQGPLWGKGNHVNLAILLDIGRSPWKQDIRKQLITNIYEGWVVWKYRNSRWHQINEISPLHSGSPDLEESTGTFFTFLLPTMSDSEDPEYTRLNITKESRRENSEPQNLLCYKN